MKYENLQFPDVKKVALSLSGGLDSTTLLYCLIKRYGAENVYALSFDYNQKQSIELEKAKATCEKLNVYHKVINLGFLGDIVGNVSSNIKGSDIEVPTIQEVLGDPQPQSVDINSKLLVKRDGKYIITTLGLCRVGDESFYYDFDDGTVKLGTVSYVYTHKPNKDVYKITTKGGFELIATDDHSIYCITKPCNEGELIDCSQLHEKKTSELTTGDLLYTPHIPLYNYVSQDTNIKLDLLDHIKLLRHRDTPCCKGVRRRINRMYDELQDKVWLERGKSLCNRFIDIDAYLIQFIAFYVTEGTLTKHGVTLCNTVNYDDLIANISQKFNCSYSVREKVLPSGKTLYVYTLYSAILRDLMLMLCGKKHNKRTPDLLFNVSTDLQKLYIDNYIDFDGSYDHSIDSHVMITVSEDNKDRLCYLLQCIGYNFRVNVNRVAGTTGQIHGVVFNRNHDVYRINTRKIQLSTAKSTNMFRRIKSIEKVDPEQYLVGDISLNGTFIANNILVHNTYIPFRNTIFTSLLLAFAEANDCSAVALGIQATDLYGYYDTTPEFVKCVQNICELNRKNYIQLFTPFVTLTKEDEIRIGVDIGVDYASTLTCYNPDEHGHSCGICATCAERIKAFATVGVADPVQYLINIPWDDLFNQYC